MYIKEVTKIYLIVTYSNWWFKGANTSVFNLKHLGNKFSIIRVFWFSSSFRDNMHFRNFFFQNMTSPIHELITREKNGIPPNTDLS